MKKPKYFKIRVARIVKVGGDSLGITIPMAHIKFNELKDGDYLTVWYKQVIIEKEKEWE